jgi:hypothetical protein
VWSISTCKWWPEEEREEKGGVQYEALHLEGGAEKLFLL